MSYPETRVTFPGPGRYVIAFDVDENGVMAVLGDHAAGSTVRVTTGDGTEELVPGGEGWIPVGETRSHFSTPEEAQAMEEGRTLQNDVQSTSLQLPLLVEDEGDNK